MSERGGLLLLLVTFAWFTILLFLSLSRLFGERSGFGERSSDDGMCRRRVVVVVVVVVVVDVWFTILLGVGRVAEATSEELI